MQTDKISWVLAGISLIAIIISFLTLKEMKNQREIEISPILQLNPFNGELISGNIQEGCDSLVYFHNYNVIEDDNGRPKLDLVNLGFGPALNITTEWNTDFKWIEKHIKQNNISDSLLKIITTENDIYVEYKRCYGMAKHSFSITKSEQLAHLPSSNTSSKPQQLEIPREVILPKIALFRADWISNGINGNNNDYQIKSNHLLSVKFNSINGRKFTEDYRLEISLKPRSSGSEKLLGKERTYNATSVSYTHLTLPTIYSV